MKAVDRPAEHSRYIPPEMRREVYARDGGQCRFIGRDGQRCSARDWLEFHHDGKPFGQGGVTSVENLCLMCRAHNSLLAERVYGRAYMRERIARSTRETRSTGETRATRGLEFDPFPGSNEHAPPPSS